jgi:TonB family protein
VVVTDKGEVKDIRVVEAPNKSLADTAVDAVKTWKFKPAIGPNGKPVTAKVIVEVTFRPPAS